MQECWHDDTSIRPPYSNIVDRLRTMKDKIKSQMAEHSSLNIDEDLTSQVHLKSYNGQ